MGFLISCHMGDEQNVRLVHVDSPSAVNYTGGPYVSRGEDKGRFRPRRVPRPCAGTRDYEDVGDGARSRKVDQPDVADVVAAASGDLAAFDRLVRTMQGRVWRYIIHIVGDHSLAEDLAQEVFLRMHRKLHTLRDPERFVSWLLSMARNAAFDAGRSGRRHPLHLIGDDVLPETGPSPDPHLRFEVFEALQSLDDELREAVVLVAVSGFSYQEAAGAIGIPEGTVKSRVFRGRKQLIALLGLGVGDVD